MKQALQGAGLVARRKRRGSHRRRRPRTPMPGMLLHIDGSKHRWFSDDRYFDLLVILDVSVRWGPHLLTTVKAERDGGKDGTSGAFGISPTPRDSHFAHRPATTTRTLKKAKSRAA